MSEPRGFNPVGDHALRERVDPPQDEEPNSWSARSEHVEVAAGLSFQRSVCLLLVSSEERVDSSIAVFADAAHLSLFLSHEQRRRGPDLFDLAPSFYDDWQYFCLLILGQGEALGESVYSVVGATTGKRRL